MLFSEVTGVYHEDHSKSITLFFEWCSQWYVQGDSGGKFSILGGDICHCEKKLRMNMCLILIGSRDRTV